MHMADALVAPAVAGTMYLASSVTAGYSIKKVRLTEEPKKIPLMGVMGAFVFAAQMINFTIPGTGSSGHLTGGMMLSALLGPCAGFIAMIGVLLIQCLFFADGGLLALGCNVWNMAFYGCFIGAMVIWRLMMKNGVNKKRIVAASVVGCIVTLQLGAFSVVLETGLSGVTELPFSMFAGVMQPIHLAIGLVEGLITAAVLCFVYEARPELLWTGELRRYTDAVDADMVKGAAINAHNKVGSDIGTDNRRGGRLSYHKTLAVLGVSAVFVGGMVSLLASAFPDGLEWAIEKLTGSTELEAAGGIYSIAARVQDFTALFPYYGFSGAESAAGTSFSGVIGGLVVLLVLVTVCKLCRLFGQQGTREQHE